MVKQDHPETIDIKERFNFLGYAFSFNFIFLMAS